MGYGRKKCSRRVFSKHLPYSVHPGLGRFSERVTGWKILVCHAQRHTKITAIEEFSLFPEDI